METLSFVLLPAQAGGVVVARSPGRAGSRSDRSVGTCDGRGQIVVLWTWKTQLRGLLNVYDPMIETLNFVSKRRDILQAYAPLKDYNPLS